MPCGCNSICDNDCGSNQLCTGNVAACVNSYAFSAIIVGDLIKASDLIELQTAIDNERTDGARRFNSSDPTYCATHTPGNVACSTNDWSGYSWTAGVVAESPVLAQHYDDIKDANNEVVNDSGFGSLVTATFAADGVIYSVDVNELQTKINTTRNACICDSHCNCDPSDCGCNGECPSDDAYYS